MRIRELLVGAKENLRLMGAQEEARTVMGPIDQERKRIAMENIDMVLCKLDKLCTDLQNENFAP